MKSLASMSLSTITSNDDLITSIEKCEANHQLKDICDDNPQFWKDKLIQLFGDDGYLLIMKRQDIVNGLDWYAFVKALATGTSFKYAIGIDYDDGSHSKHIFPYYGRMVSRRNYPDITFELMQIDGTSPSIGTVGYYVSVISNLGQPNVNSIHEIFLSNNDDRSLRLACLKWSILEGLNRLALNMEIEHLEEITANDVNDFQMQVDMRNEVNTVVSLTDFIVNQSINAIGFEDDPTFFYISLVQDPEWYTEKQDRTLNIIIYPIDVGTHIEFD